MSLHGKIQVNSTDVGSWMARRLEPLSDEHDEHDYIVNVVMPARRNLISRMAAQEFTATLRHRYSDGALRLAAEVLGAADEFA